MRHNEERHSLSSLCALLGYSRQAFYQFEKNNNQACFEAELVIQQVLLHRSLQPRLGARKLLMLMQDFIREHQLKLGRDALFDLLRAHKLLVKKRRRKVQTTFSKHWQKKYPNLILGYAPKAPNSLRVSDITARAAPLYSGRRWLCLLELGDRCLQPKNRWILCIGNTECDGKSKGLIAGLESLPRREWINSP